MSFFSIDTSAIVVSRFVMFSTVLSTSAKSSAYPSTQHFQSENPSASAAGGRLIQSLLVTTLRNGKNMYEYHVSIY